MIIQSPESAMPEPYKTYVSQRSETIARVLAEVVGDHNVQLCPRAVTPEEQLFANPADIVYGAVVKSTPDGLKSALYSTTEPKHGVVSTDAERVQAYALAQFGSGNRIRVKDAAESDGQGQVVASSIEDLEAALTAVEGKGSHAVVMPHLAMVTQRISVGHINLGGAGSFHYLGQEDAQSHNGAQVYGGTTLGLFPSGSAFGTERALTELDIPRDLAEMGLHALEAYQSVALSAQRVSVDVIEGITDNGSLIRDVVDLTPRVGGTTPAEVLAMREIYTLGDAVCFARSTLLYDPEEIPTTGVNFIDTDTLVINAEVLGVHQ